MEKNFKAFRSNLKEEFDAYLQFRDSQGHDSRKERIVFLTLDKYIQESHISTENKSLASSVIEGWLKSLPSSLGVNSRNLYISHYTQFAMYLRSKGVDAFIPEKSLPDKTYAPYIFTKEELDRLVVSADKRVDSTFSYVKRNAVCFSILLRMLIGCGFRINELLNLKTSDVDMLRQVITIRNAKGNKDRIVPVHETLAEVLRAYSASGIPQPEGYFLATRTGNRFSYSWARDNFNKCLTEIGIIKPDLNPHARNICIHCIRHSYAVTAFRKLELEGKDLYSEAPILSTYMGHKNIYGTETYLHATAVTNAEILQKMSDYNVGIFPEVDL